MGILALDVPFIHHDPDVEILIQTQTIVPAVFKFMTVCEALIPQQVANDGSGSCSGSSSAALAHAGKADPIFPLLITIMAE